MFRNTNCDHCSSPTINIGIKSPIMIGRQKKNKAHRCTDRRQAATLKLEFFSEEVVPQLSFKRSAKAAVRSDVPNFDPPVHPSIFFLVLKVSRCPFAPRSPYQTNLCTCGFRLILFQHLYTEFDWMDGLGAFWIVQGRVLIFAMLTENANPSLEDPQAPRSRIGRSWSCRKAP